MRTFEFMLWDGTIEKSRGNTLGEALNAAGYSKGAEVIISRYRVVKSLPMYEKYLYLLCKEGAREIINPLWVDEIRKHINPCIGEIISVPYKDKRIRLCIVNIKAHSIILQKELQYYVH